MGQAHSRLQRPAAGRPGGAVARPFRRTLAARPVAPLVAPKGLSVAGQQLHHQQAHDRLFAAVAEPRHFARGHSRHRRTGHRHQRRVPGRRRAGVHQSDRLLRPARAWPQRAAAHQGAAPPDSQQPGGLCVGPTIRFEVSRSPARAILLVIVDRLNIYNGKPRAMTHAYHFQQIQLHVVRRKCARRTVSVCVVFLAQTLVVDNHPTFCCV